jgi:hypothetical protein
MPKKYMKFHISFILFSTLENSICLHLNGILYFKKEYGDEWNNRLPKLCKVTRDANRGQHVGIRLWHPRARSVIWLWTKPRLISIVLGFGRNCSVIGKLQAVTSNYGVTNNATV